MLGKTQRYFISLIRCRARSAEDDGKQTTPDSTPDAYGRRLSDAKRITAETDSLMSPDLPVSATDRGHEVAPSTAAGCSVLHYKLPRYILSRIQQS